MADAEGRLAIFAIVVREPQSFRLLGTGFYLQPKGGFAPPPMSEALQIMAALSVYAGIFYFMWSMQ
jgi:hypothetical protein